MFGGGLLSLQHLLMSQQKGPASTFRLEVGIADLSPLSFEG